MLEGLVGYELLFLVCEMFMSQSQHSHMYSLLKTTCEVMNGSQRGKDIHC